MVVEEHTLKSRQSGDDSAVRLIGALSYFGLFSAAGLLVTVCLNAFGWASSLAAGFLVVLSVVLVEIVTKLRSSHLVGTVAPIAEEREAYRESALVAEIGDHLRDSQPHGSIQEVSIARATAKRFHALMDDIGATPSLASHETVMEQCSQATNLTLRPDWILALAREPAFYIRGVVVVTGEGQGYHFRLNCYAFLSARQKVRASEQMVAGTMAS